MLLASVAAQAEVMPSADPEEIVAEAGCESQAALSHHQRLHLHCLRSGPCCQIGRRLCRQHCDLALPQLPADQELGADNLRYDQAFPWHDKPMMRSHLEVDVRSESVGPA